jgi:hypothetical protein
LRNSSAKAAPTTSTAAATMSLLRRCTCSHRSLPTTAETRVCRYPVSGGERRQIELAKENRAVRRDWHRYIWLKRQSLAPMSLCRSRCAKRFQRGLAVA